MKVKVAQFLEYLKQNKLTAEDFAKKLHLSIDEVEKLLAGKAVGINTARIFISGLGVELAQNFIDWDAISKNNPLNKEDKRTAGEDLFDNDEDVSDFENFEEDYYGEDEEDEYDD